MARSLLVLLLLLLAAAPSAGADPLPDCRQQRSRSIGAPGNGRLVRGVLFPASGPDHSAPAGVVRWPDHDDHLHAIF